MARTAPVFLCGVPSSLCIGGAVKGFNHSLVLPPKAHGSAEEAFNCKAHSLIKQGYTRIAPREFRPSDGGPIKILTKPIRFGCRLRMGKEGTRHMPRSGGGVIIG